MSEPIFVCGVPFFGDSMDACVARCAQAMRTHSTTVLHTANAQALVLCERGYRELFCTADLIVPDGDGVLLAARLQGKRLPNGKIAGIELLTALLALCAQEGFSVYLLGGREGVAHAAAERLCARFARLHICGMHHGYFSEAQEAAVVAQIRKSRPHFLVVCLGMPRQEAFMRRHAATLGVPLMGGFGGSLDVLSGAVRRAPVWIQRLHAEWLYRVVRQPRRIGRLRGYGALYARLLFGRGERETGQIL